MGAENYVQWHCQMTLALKGEHLWNHCSNSADLTDFAELTLDKPSLANLATITDAEKEKILDWLAKDLQAKALINRKISSVITTQLNEGQTTHEQWEILLEQYSRNDLLSQYELCTRVCLEKLKDADNAPWYLGVFEDARHCFIQMGVSYSNEEAIFYLLQGLPDGIEWQICKEFTMKHMSTPSTTTPTTTMSAPASFTCDDVTKSFSKKANTIIGRRKQVQNHSHARCRIKHQGQPCNQGVYALEQPQGGEMHQYTMH